MLELVILRYIEHVDCCGFVSDCNIECYYYYYYYYDANKVDNDEAVPWDAILNLSQV